MTKKEKKRNQNNTHIHKYTLNARELYFEKHIHEFCHVISQ